MDEDTTTPIESDEEADEQVEYDPSVAEEAQADLEEAVAYDKTDREMGSSISVGKKLGSAKHAFIPMSKAYRFAALYLTPEQIKQAAMWKRPPGWPSFVPWSAPIVKACQMWLNPNIGAAMEIADRTEGKVKQTLEVENRGIVALPLLQVSTADEWHKMFSPIRQTDPDVTVTVIESRQPAALPAPAKRKPGRPKKAK
jgi:hypothetical protein